MSSMNPSPFLFFTIQFLLLPLISSYSQQGISTTHINSDSDLKSLLAFKEQVIDASGTLAANWTTNVSFCSWIGISCSPRHQRVNSLNLNSFSLQGTISPYLGNLSFLYNLNLGNNSLTGPIPEALGRLPRLRWINLKENSLFGHIPSSFFNMSSVLSIFLYQNNLTGTLPSNNSLMILPQLQFLSLDANQLTGPIPSSFSLCSNLQKLGLTQNAFSGTIPAELGILSKLTQLHLSINQLTGTIPISLGNLTNLQKLHLNINHLEGVIPETLGNLQKLQTLHLGYNHLTGSIPDSLFNSSMLQQVELSFNNLTGSIPVTLGKSVPQLTVLWMAVNQLTGGLDFLTSLSNCRNLSSLDVGANKIKGFIPDSVGNLSVLLQRFDIGENNILGNIPAGFGNLSSLSYLYLAINQLNGTIPLALTGLQKMEAFYLGANSISGSIPVELGLMKRMSMLNLEMNLLSGPIPDSLGNLSRLQILDLSDNKLASSIPMSLWGLSSLIGLYLRKNMLHGSIPLQVGNLKVLDKMFLNNNQFSGNISTSFGELQMLTYLDLSNNSFKGQIPESLSGLVNIEYLNLSHNSLSNTIPKSLANLRYLSTLDLSFNKLEGQIPAGRVFSNQSIPSLVGNLALCGAPMLSFPPCSINTDTSVSRRKSHLLSYILPAIASIVVILVCFCFYLLLKFRQRRRPKTPTDDILTLSDHSLISYYELVRATDNFSEANLVGRGSVGSVFKACLDNGSVIAVKVFNLDVQGAVRSFDAECQALRMVRHRNLVKIITTCSNLDFKALILEFMVNGSLESHLYADDSHVSLHQRLNIMVDVSLALEYLHHNHENVILHCDLKPSNVLLDENMIAHLGDFGIAKLLSADSRSEVMTSTRGTIGYIPPEYGYSDKVSTKGDVYTFGILLLEIFTRKRPTDVMFNEELNLRQWVRNAYPAALLDILDCNLLRDCTEQGQEEYSTAVQQCLSSAIGLGLLCSGESPKERIPMKDVVPRLQKIKVDFLTKFPGV